MDQTLDYEDKIKAKVKGYHRWYPLIVMVSLYVGDMLVSKLPVDSSSPFFWEGDAREWLKDNGFAGAVAEYGDNNLDLRITLKEDQHQQWIDCQTLACLADS